MNPADSSDIEIVMHRDAHFGGHFGLMLDYYRKGGKGIVDTIDISRIEELAEEELQIGSNIAPSLLSDKDTEEVERAKEAYEDLRKLYGIKTPKNKFPLLIADLILSENEEAEHALQRVVEEKSEIIPYLIKLLQSEDFYNPLFPGYGKAYQSAVQALGLIGDKRALIALFESIGRGGFFDDEASLNALKAIGEPAKTFLLKVLEGRPFNEDNEKAAIALLGFKDDPEVASTCFSLLKELDLVKEGYLATYLILASENLPLPLREEFKAFASGPSIPKTLQNDFKVIIESWNSPLSH